MLTILVPRGEEHYDEESDRFFYPDAFELTLEHSLVSLSKWEVEFKKPFLEHHDKTPEETWAYIHHMVIEPKISREELEWLSEDNIKAISDYISAQQTATWFTEHAPEPKSNELITSELIYFWMSSFGIPFQPTESWHLSRLLTLIRVAGLKSSKPKKMSRAEIAERQRRLNKQRREQLGTKG